MKWVVAFEPYHKMDADWVRARYMPCYIATDGIAQEVFPVGWTEWNARRKARKKCKEQNRNLGKYPTLADIVRERKEYDKAMKEIPQ